ncbi:MAG: cysteine desulfurase family protein [Proteobacteria bacterium]|nr:cysteine desulfurase family protein [Pseudomonadota bacterium]
MIKRVYFDNNATTKLAPQALEVMQEAYQAPFNPSAIHALGRDANKIIDAARQEIQSLVNGNNYEVIFTSGGTEANNLAIFGLQNHQIITSEIEHSSIYEAACKKGSLFIDIDENGVINLNHLAEILHNLPKGEPFLVSIMLANNETGAIQPIKEAAQLVHKKGGLIHCDMVQALGKLEIDLVDLDIDLASISAHKIHGPQGVGALITTKCLEIQPILFGGFQEQGKRAGTHNVAGIAGFGAACKIANSKVQQYQEIAVLRDSLEQALKEIAGDELTIFSENVARLPNTSFMAIDGLDNQTQLINFDLNNIALSIGSSCSSGSTKPSRVLKAMGYDDKVTKYALRVSLGLENTKDEIEKFINILGKLYSNHKGNN